MLGALSDDELWDQLGSDLLGAKRAARVSRSDRIKHAREWFDENRERFRESLCADPAAVALMNPSGETTADEAAVIADLLLALVGDAPPVITVAVIIARRGIRWLCG